ncbi:MAG: EamA family transporter [Proteobacteria bacterium]|nr:EamA family transporter [Pseudomonadota bacterium]
MTPLATALWLANAGLDTGGQLCFKAAAHHGDNGWRALARQPMLWLGLLCYLGEFLAWIAFLSQVPLSLGVLLGSINIVVVMICGRLFFREKLTPLRVGGILLVCIGVALVGIGA